MPGKRHKAERYGSEMTEKYGRVYATVDLDALRANAEGMVSALNQGTKMIGVVKADGYGHGAVPAAKELEALGEIWGFAAATEEEAVILRKSGIGKPILSLGYAFPHHYKEMIENDIRITVFRQDTLEQLARAAGETGKEKTMRLVFMGTPAFAVPSLEGLVKAAADGIERVQIGVEQG